MGFFAILIFSLVLVGGNLINKSENNQVEKKKIEVVANKPAGTKPAIKEITPEPVKEEIIPEPVKEEIIPEPVKEEIIPEPVKEEIIPEPVKEEIIPEPVKEEVKELDDLEESGTNYLRLVLYIIGGFLVALTGMYFFSRKRNSTPSSIQPETTEPQPAEEEVQPETTEPQPAEEEVQPETTEPQPVEEEVQPETTEEQKTEEDENNNK